MLQLLLHLLGVHPEKAGHLSDWTIDLRGGIWPGWLLLAAVLLGSAVFWMYRRSAEHLPLARRIVLSSLRTLFLVMLLAILARPVLRLTVRGTIRRSVLMLIDASQSMSIPDLRSEEADIKRAAIARDMIDPAKGLDQPLERSRASSISQISRLEMIRAVLRNPRIDLIKRIGQDYVVQPFTFGAKVNDAGKLDSTDAGAVTDFINSLKASEPLTRLGDSVSDVLGRMRGQPIAGLVLITDGQSNSGRSIVLAAEQARLEGVPLYVYGVGIASPKDIIVSNIFTRDVAFVKDELPVSVRVRNANLHGEPAHLVLSLNGKEVDAQDIVLDESGEQVVPMKFTPVEKGEYTLKARIEPRPDEASKDNNEATEPLKIVDSKIKILYVEKSPRWEFKYLTAMLLRDRRVDLKILLLEGDPALSTPDNSPYVKQFPTSAEELTQFDLIVLGDVDPHTFTDQQLQDIGRWVQIGGGGLLAIAGREFNPFAYAGTKIGELLPIDIVDERGGRVGKSIDSAESAEQPIRLDLTPSGRENIVMRLADTAQASSDIWAKFPPIYWDARIFRAKPGADVLVVDTDPTKQSTGGKMPVIVLGQPGIGQVMYVGTDNTWRWRKNGGEKYYTALWGQIVQRLSLPHLLGSSKRTQISADQQKYNVGDKITIVARLYDESLRPIELKELKAFYQIAGSDPSAFKLRPAGDQKGIYRGEFIAPAPGAYKAWVESDDKTKRDFSVVQTNVELGETAMNEAGLREMAGSSGGKFFHEEDLVRLPDELRNKSENIQSIFEVELWSTWLYLSLLIFVVTLEWVLRKLAMMK